MERRKRTLRLFSLLLAMSSLLVASGVSASKPGYEPAYVNGKTVNVPFKGTLQGHESDSQFSKGPPPTIVVTTSGTGIGTHLGEFSFAQEVTVNLAAVTDTGSAHWVAANGDSIDVTIVGSGEPMATPDGIVFSITEILLVAQVDLREPKGALSQSAWQVHKRSSPSAHSTGPLLPRVQNSQHSRGPTFQAGNHG